jgi:NAD(P)-dependent dehydrogenase (short-subunit alcohol dehydrogenase family)
MASTMKLFDLTGRSAIVTGGAGSPGSAVAKGLAAAGAKVAVSDLKQENADRVREEIVRAGGHATGIACHSTRESDVVSLFDKAEAELGPVDILVNAVACPIARHQPQDVTLETFQGLQDGILNCFFLTCREAGRRMIAAKRPGRGSSDFSGVDRDRHLFLAVFPPILRNCLAFISRPCGGQKPKDMSAKEAVGFRSACQDSHR